MWPRREASAGFWDLYYPCVQGLLPLSRRALYDVGGNVRSGQAPITRYIIDVIIRFCFTTTHLFVVLSVRELPAHVD
jgi:hypothetical protein